MAYVKRNAIAGREFSSWAEFDAHLVRWNGEVADLRVYGTTGEAPLERFMRAEAQALHPLAAKGRSKVHYLEGWQVIVEANRIFGFDGWQRQTLAVRCVNQAERLIGREQRPGWGVTYTARVRVTVTAGGRPPLVREGSGAGFSIPEEATTIADRILQKRHHDWIEAFLVQHQGAGAAEASG